MGLHRISTLAVLLFGLVLYFFIIPTQVEQINYGWVKPSTVPNALAIMICAVAIIQLFTAAEIIDETPTLQQLIYAFLFFAGVGVCTYLMPIVGFLPMAVIMAVALMFAVGERRWLWIAIGGVLLPSFIWYATEMLLGRPLP